MVYKVFQVAIPFIWFGAVSAISFMEAPLKFTAPNIDLSLGLGIGYVVFHALNKVEIVLCLLMAATFVFARPKTKMTLVVYGILFGILSIQTFWLFPLLDERTLQVIKGEAPPYSNLHIVYIVLDSLKILLLLFLGALITCSHMKEKSRSD